MFPLSIFRIPSFVRVRLENLFPLLPFLFLHGCSTPPIDITVKIRNNTDSCENRGYSIDLLIDGVFRGTIPPSDYLEVILKEGCHVFSTSCHTTGVFRSEREKCIDRYDPNFTLSGYCDTCPSDFEFDVLIYNDTIDCENGGYPISVMVDEEMVEKYLDRGDSITVALPEAKHCFTSLCLDGSFRSEVCRYVDEEVSPIHFKGFCDECEP